MSEELGAAMRRVHMSAVAVDAEGMDDWINEDDEQAEQKRPGKRERQSAEDLEKELEHEFLTPSTKFSQQWLNRLQR
jgi:antiviral helicase SKI2